MGILGIKTRTDRLLEELQKANKNNEILLRENKELDKIKKEYSTLAYALQDKYYDLKLESALRSGVYEGQQQTGNQRKALKKAMQSNNFIKTIVNLLVTEALVPGNNTNNIINVTYPSDPKIEEHLQDFNSRLNINQLLPQVGAELILYGQTYFKNIIKPGNYRASDSVYGIVDIRASGDDSVFALEKSGQNVGFLAINENMELELCSPLSYTQFALRLYDGDNKVDLYSYLKGTIRDRKELEEFQSILPRYAYIGSSMIYPMLEQLNLLNLLDTIAPAQIIKAAAKNTILSVGFNENQNVSQALEVIREIEGLLNSNSGVDNMLQQISLANTVNSTGKIKVVPQFGGKGQLSYVDLKDQSLTDLFNLKKEIETDLLNTIGLSYSDVFENETGDPKYKTYSRSPRYVKKLNQIQAAIIEGLKNLYTIDCTQSGYNDFDAELLNFEFENKLVDDKILNELERQDIMLAVVNNALSTVDTIFQNPALTNRVDYEALGDRFEEILNSAGLTGVIKPKERSLAVPPSYLPDDTDIDSDDANDPFISDDDMKSVEANIADPGDETPETQSEPEENQGAENEV